MTARTAFMISIVLLCASAATGTAQDEWPELSGPYLGQKPPGPTPVVFAPGIISTDKKELNSVFTPDGNEFYFSLRDPQNNFTIWYTAVVNGKWSRPRVAPFSGTWSDVDMCISHDGRRMMFGSVRPAPGGGSGKSDFRIWVVERQGDSWGEPHPVDPPVFNMQRSLYPSLTRDGTLYFQGIGKESFGERDIYCSRLGPGGYREPENLGPAINSRHGEGDVLIAPDESFLIVCINGRPDSLGGGDLYVSFRDSDGAWSPVVNMGAPINSSATDYCPMLSPDGNYFFFTSRRTDNDDIYWVQADVIQSFRPSPEN